MTIHVPRKLTDEHVTIYHTEGDGFRLCDSAGVVLVSAPNPRVLSKYAFNADAQSVAHRYDLALAET